MDKGLWAVGGFMVALLILGVVSGPEIWHWITGVVLPSLGNIFGSIPGVDKIFT